MSETVTQVRKVSNRVHSLGPVTDILMFIVVCEYQEGC